MKKKIVAMVLSMAMVASFTACGKDKKEETVDSAVIEPVIETISVPTEDSNDEDSYVYDSGSADGYINSIDDYISGLSMMVGSDFDVQCGYSQQNGLYPSLDTEGGIMYYVRPDYTDSLVLVGFGGSDNNIYINSVRYKDHDIEDKGSVTLDKIIDIEDECKILFSTVELDDGCQAIMVEERGAAYSFADGVSYYIYLVKIEKDGSLNLICDTYTAGSGDEDITEHIRNDFNTALNTTYSQDYFEDMFYDGNMYIEKEKLPIKASITYTSYTSDFANNNDWDSVNEYNDRIYSLNYGETVHWGDGHLVVY